MSIDPSSIRPFQIQVGDNDLADLKDRLGRTRWPNAEVVDDWSQGLPLEYAKELCEYWEKSYDWRAREALLNQFPQFTAEIDGVDIHFIHVESPVADAKPLILTHGWPGSIVEFQKVIGPLSDPVSHGGDAGDAFHVVCPSLPGYGFSGKPKATGWGIEKIASAWDQLMVALGYDSYFAQGGDWGSMVTTALGANHSDNVAAIHLNMPIAPPSAESMADLTEFEQASLASMEFYDKWDSGYSKQQSTRPQTLGYGLADSPMGQCSWIVEKFFQWTDCDGHPENVLTRDELLDNVMLYWLPGNGASSARLYWESFSSVNMGAVDVPMGASIFPKEIFRTSRRWAEGRFSNIVHWNQLDKGGHFAAFEVPDVFVDEIRTCFRSVR